MVQGPLSSPESVAEARRDARATRGDRDRPRPGDRGRRWHDRDDRTHAPGRALAGGADGLRDGDAASALEWSLVEEICRAWDAVTVSVGAALAATGLPRRMRLDAARRAFGLPPNKKSEIDEDELKRIYRKEAIKCHPDKCPGDENATARFQELSEAYQILTGQADPSDDEWSSDDEWTHGTKNAGRQRNTKKKQQQTKSAPKQRRQRKSRGQRGSKAAKDFFEDLFGVRKPYTPPLPNACVHAHFSDILAVLTAWLQPACQLCH